MKNIYQTRINEIYEKLSLNKKDAFLVYALCVSFRQKQTKYDVLKFITELQNRPELQNRQENDGIGIKVPKISITKKHNRYNKLAVLEEME